jgi:hypothetical protein
VYQWHRQAPSHDTDVFTVTEVGVGKSQRHRKVTPFLTCEVDFPTIEAALLLHSLTKNNPQSVPGCAAPSPSWPIQSIYVGCCPQGDRDTLLALLQGWLFLKAGGFNASRPPSTTLFYASFCGSTSPAHRVLACGVHSSSNSRSFAQIHPSVSFPNAPARDR